MHYTVSNGSIYNPGGIIIEEAGFILTVDKDDPDIVLINAIGDYNDIAKRRLPRLQPMAHVMDIICFGFTTSDYNIGLHIPKDKQVSVLNHMMHVTGSPKTKEIAHAILAEDRNRLETAFASVPDEMR